MEVNEIQKIVEAYEGFIPLIGVFVFGIVLFSFLSNKKSWKKKKIVDLKEGEEEQVHGIIFGRRTGKLSYSPENAEGHVGVFSASGTGKTSAVGIPTLRSWRGTSYTIDISGDICKNCPDMPNKLVYAPEEPETVPYNVFGAIDDMTTEEEKNEALEQLAFLLMPDVPNINANAKYYLDNGRKILTASLIAFYWGGLDFIQIAEKVIGSSWRELFREIDKTGNQLAMMYISSFDGPVEENVAGCKQSCDDALKLFATNGKIKRSIHRPAKGTKAVEPKMIEINNIFIVVGEDKLSLYAPLMNIFTSQILQYIGTRQVNETSSTILLFLDEFASLNLDAQLILDGVRRFRKRKCRIMLLMQNTVDMNILYGNESTRAILANLKYKVLLGGLGEPESQKYFAELIGYKEVKKHSVAKNAKQITRTESTEKEWIIEPAELDRQGKDTVILISADIDNGYLKLKKNYYFKK